MTPEMLVVRLLTIKFLFLEIILAEKEPCQESLMETNRKLKSDIFLFYHYHS